MCSSTGHLMEFDPNSCEVLHLYRIIKYRPDGNKGESSAKIYHLSGHKEATKYADCKPGVGLTNLAWIQQDFPTPHGWLVTGSDDGCLRLWDELSPTATPKLEVKYAGPICSLSVSLIEPISERQDVSKDTDGLPFATIALSTKTGGLAGLILSVEYPSDCCGGESGYPKLDRSRPVISGCTPMRLLSWPLDGPIVSTDLVSFNPSGSCSILCIATLHGSIKIWKLLSSTRKVGVSKTEFPGDVCLRNLPLFDLRVSGDPPCHVSLQPAVIEGQTSETTDYSWLRLGCGYRGTGLVRIFDPSSASLLYTLTTDNMCDVTALLFSSCGTYLYATDTSGELALWDVPQIRLPYHHEKKEREPRLLKNRSRAVAVFRRCVEPSFKHTYSSLTCCLSQSDLTLSPDDQKLVYVDQTHLLITVAQAYTLETLFQVDLNRAVDKNPGESFEVVGDQLDHRRILLNFSCRNPITDSHDLLVARPDGYLCRFEGSTGELIAHCRPPHSVNEKDDRKDHKTKYCEMQEGAYWSAMCVSPDGKHVVLAAAARPVLYTTTTDLCQLPDGPEKNYTNSSASVPKFRQFVGHLHAISAILITGDQHFCLTVDGGVGVTNEASTPALGSAIYVWQLSKSKRRQITEHSLSGTALPRVPITGNKTPREKSTAIPWTSEQHKTGVCFKEATPISQPNGENAITKSGNHPSSVPWQHSYRNSSPRDSRRPISTEFDRITWEESHLRFMPLRTYSGKCIHGLIGYTNQPVAVDSVVWDPDSGLFVYTADAFLICESLESGEQVVYATQLAKDGRQTNLSPVLIRELLNSLVLSPNRRLLVIGATALWSEAGQCMKSTRRSLVTSAIVSMPVKFTRLYRHRGLSAPEQRVTLDYESVHRLHYSSILWHCLEANEAASIGPRTTPAPMLKTMAFSSSSQYLITAGDESAPIVCLWCVRTWTLLSFTWITAIITKISCSFLYPMDFVTVGYVHREPPTPHQGHLLFWHIDNAEQKLVDEPPASTMECVDKLSTAVYLLGPETCNGNSPLWLQSVTLREILIVATATGSIDVWNPVRRCKLAHCPTGDAEIGLLSPCGPFSFVTGSASGTLSLWRVINASCLQQLHRSMNAAVNSDHNEDACVNQCIVGLKLIKQITGLPEGSGQPITSATFDPEGQIGIVASGRSTLRYIDWCDVETCSQSTRRSSNANTDYGHTCLLSAPSAALIGLFCLKRAQLPSDESSLVNEKPKAEVVLVSVTSHGTIQVWDPHSRERISELRVGPHPSLAPTAMCACCLENSTGICVEGPCTGSSRMLGVQAACLVVAFSDTSIRLICLHRMTPVASTKALSPANADSAAAIQFLGTSHLVMGTNRGFLILLRITARRSEWKLVPLRILKEHVNQNLHFNCVHQLEVFPSEVSFDPIDFTSRSVGTAFSKDLARKCERAIPGVQSTAIHMQSNRTFLSELKQIEQTPAWLWLAISGDRRLSVWLFIDRRQFECVNERVVSLERCHLIAWLLLDSLVEVRPIGKSENAAEKHHFHEEKTGVSGSDLGSNFKVKFVQKKPAHNKRTICAMAPLESISILIAHSNSINQTQLLLHSFYPTQLPMKLSTVSGMLDSLLVTPSKTTTNQSLSIEPTRAFLLTRVDDRVKLLSAVFDAGSAVCSDWVELIHLPLSTRSTGPNPPLLRLLPTNGDDFDHEASVVVALGANLIIL